MYWMSENPTVYEIIEELKRTNTHFYLLSTQPHVITICIAFPGERIEIDVHGEESCCGRSILIAHFTGEEVSEMSFDTLLGKIREDEE